MLRNKISACVILYNPDECVIGNIESYVGYVQKLFIIDNGNGESVIDNLVDKYYNIYPIYHKENMGIAYSLNEVLRLVNGEYDLLMTMDQDSRFCDGCMEAFLKEISKFNWNETMGIGPKTVDIDTPFDGNAKWHETETLNTSGNIISVKNAIKIGMFDESLFIDEVDREFNYRSTINDFKNFVAENGIYLKHRIGEPLKKFIIFKNFECQNHNYIRKYYIFRNRLYVYKKYHKINEKYFFKYYIKYSLYMFLGIVIIENDKIRKLRYCIKGIYDAIYNNMGRLSEK